MQRSFHTTNIKHHVVAKCRLAAMLDFPHVENQPAGAMFFRLKVVLGIAITIVNCRYGNQERLHAFIIHGVTAPY